MKHEKGNLTESFRTASEFQPARFRRNFFGRSGCALRKRYLNSYKKISDRENVSLSDSI